MRAIRPSVRVERVSYSGWRLKEAALTLADGTALACNPLLGSESTAPEGLTAEVCDLGRGRPKISSVTRRIFPAASCSCATNILSARSTSTGAASSGGRWSAARRVSSSRILIPARARLQAHPAAAAGRHSGGRNRFRVRGAIIAQRRKRGRAHLKSIGEDYSAETSVLTLDLPGRTPQWVTLSAHLDGHDLAESAMDNATGVATALAVARACAPHRSQCNRGDCACACSAPRNGRSPARSNISTP